MPAPFNDLLSKVEAALKSVVDSLGLTGCTVNTGTDDDTLETPYAVCQARNAADNELRDLGVWTVEAAVMVGSSADDVGTDGALIEHRRRVAEVIDAIQSDGIAASLSAAVPDFHCFDCHFSGLESDRVNRRWVDTIRLDITSMARDVE